MSGASKQRGRQERIESLGIQKPRLVQWWQNTDKSGVITRLALALTAAVALLVFCQTWQPAFSYRNGQIPQRDLYTRVSFQVPDETSTEREREDRKKQTVAFYLNRSQRLNELRHALDTRLVLALDAASYEDMREEERVAFEEFYTPDPNDPEADSPERRFSMLKSVLSDYPEFKALDKALTVAMRRNYENGVFQSPQHTAEDGRQDHIYVFVGDDVAAKKPVNIVDARIAEVSIELIKDLREQFRTMHTTAEAAITKQMAEQPDAKPPTLSPDEDFVQVGAMIGDWISKKLPSYQTLQFDKELTDQSREEIGRSVQTEYQDYNVGSTNAKLAKAGVPIGTEELRLLRKEWSTLIDNMHVRDKLARVSAYAGMIAALFLLCSTYIFFVDDRSLLFDRMRLAKLLLVMVLSIVLGFAAARDQWRGELIPLVLASIICAVVYGRELALLLMAAACMSLTLFLGAGLSELVTMMAACTSTILLLGRIRSRTHLFFVGATSAAITFATVIGAGIVTGQTLFSADIVNAEKPLVYEGPLFDDVVVQLLKGGFWSGFCILVSASVMTPMLPFVEKAFGVQTDLSLLELGDASHPLLRRLAQRAPGTYNHSINVASIAEAAADEIGANGLLVRVGAYFHDIGKMFKPEYFIENQTAGVNQHDSLQPAMSTLVIIAHVKDGADLARSHHLPVPIIDFILQHHGTTLVEYFYREAARRSEEDPNGESVSDKDFRYPGPKPQTLEAAVMMLADTVESASRTLVDPTPSRIQNLVDSIAQKKMSDGQFDECGLTFRQLDRIRRSLVKSLTAIYHARVKYPGQQSA